MIFSPIAEQYFEEFLFLQKRIGIFFIICSFINTLEFFLKCTILLKFAKKD